MRGEFLTGFPFFMFAQFALKVLSGLNPLSAFQF